MRKIIFNAGPAVLPEIVLAQASEGILNVNNEGISIAEISHRSQLFKSILEETLHLIRELGAIGTDHEVILMQGGARLQFAQIPMNFLSKESKAGFIDTGYWAHKAMEYAAYYGQTDIIASSQEKQYRHIPNTLDFKSTKGYAYIHLTSNNTIYGTQFHQIPVVESPLIIDMSSDVFSRVMDYSKIEFAYACAQKNIGPAGLSIAIVKKEFLARAHTQLPPVFSYQLLAAKKSNYYTPPVLATYISLLNLRWLKAQGGVSAIEALNAQKAKALYAEIDRNTLFENHVQTEDRSLMNVCFTMSLSDLEQQFITFCEKHNIIGIKGHKVTGGIRASIYNAQTMDNVQQLIQVMQAFEEKCINK
jgi:phosphoserine aminotransferase